MHLAVITVIQTKTNPATKSTIASSTATGSTAPTKPTITKTKPPLINS